MICSLFMQSVHLGHAGSVMRVQHVRVHTTSRILWSHLNQTRGAAKHSHALKCKIRRAERHEKKKKCEHGAFVAVVCHPLRLAALWCGIATLSLLQLESNDLC